MKITVFTPTYNRAYIIHNLYESLKRQTFTDFEWLVVDDGSTDQTESLFEQWMRNCHSFPIRYFRKDNGGKCSAINYGLDVAQGELFFTVDSDDYLTDDALEKIAHWEEDLPKGQNYGGLAGNLGISPKETPNKLFEGEFLDGTALDRYRMVDGERAMVFYTEVHRRYTYPLFPGEKFMTEAVAWNRMAADGYKMRFYNDIIWIYEYQEDGLTKAGNTLFLDNPRGYGLWLREKAQFLDVHTLERLKMYYTFTCDLADKYKTDVIAESISVSIILIKAMRGIHKIRRRISEKDTNACNRGIKPSEKG